MPFLIDSVTMELNRRGFGVHLIIHPVMKVRRDDERRADRGAAATRPRPRARGRVDHPRRGRAPDGPGRARALQRHVAARHRRGARRGRGLAGDARPARSRSSPSSDATRRRSTPRRSRRRGRSSPGSRTTTSRSWATATTSCRSEAASSRCVGAGSGLGILRQPAASRLARIRPAAAGGARAGARAVPPQPHEGELARHGPPAGLPRLRRRQALRRRRQRRSASGASSASTPTPPTTPARARSRSCAARSTRCSTAPPSRRQPQREGADRDPRDPPARRAVPDLGRRAVRDRDGDPVPGRAPARAAVHAPRHVRPLPVLPRLRPARPLQHREPAPHRGDPRSLGRDEHRLHDARLGVRARAAALHGLHRPRHCRARRREIETLLVAATRSWADDLEEALLEEHGEEHGNALHRRYGDAFPTAYRADWVARSRGRRHRAHRGAARTTTSR